MPEPEAAPLYGGSLRAFLPSRDLPVGGRVSARNRFVAHRQVRFGECDPAGIVFYPQYLLTFQAVTEDWWQWGLGVDYNAMIGASRIGWPMVHLEVDFRRASRAGDMLRCELSIESLGTRSLTLSIGCHGADGLRVQARLVQAMLDIPAHRAMEIPAGLRARFEAFMRGDSMTCGGPV